MKKHFVITVVALLAFACKKTDRICTCTITKTGTSTTTGKADLILFPGFPTPLADTSFVTSVNETQVTDKKIEKVTKRTAQSNCISYSEPYNETTLTSVPSASFNLSITVTNTGTKHYDCKLK